MSFASVFCNWTDSADPLTDSEKALLDARLAAYRKDPDAGSSWEDVETRLLEREDF
jgi:putative addiction module component (TIGR02574 family)